MLRFYREKHGGLIKAPDRLSGIIALAERKIGREIRAVQKRGELATRGQYDRPNVPNGNISPATLTDVGLTRKQSSDYQPGQGPRAAWYPTPEPSRAEGGTGMIASKQTFTGMRLVLDGCTFEGCAFRGCVLVYTGALPVVLAGNSYDAGCRWELSGPARRTLEFLAHLHRSGAERLVEDTFDQIRGKPPAGARLM